MEDNPFADEGHDPIGELAQRQRQRDERPVRRMLNFLLIFHCASTCEEQHIHRTCVLTAITVQVSTHSNIHNSIGIHVTTLVLLSSFTIRAGTTIITITIAITATSRNRT